VKAVRLKSRGQSVGRRIIYGGKDLWNRCVLSLEWKTVHHQPVRESDLYSIDRLAVSVVLTREISSVDKSVRQGALSSLAGLI